MERKIGKKNKFLLLQSFVTLKITRFLEIYNFAARTRQLFIRLLALVKWANSASKVDKSAVS